jgi:phosphohistidine phosphatase
MKLYVMRHGPAEDHAPSGRDADRALTPSGRDRVRAVAKALLSEGEEPHVILTSPLVRSLQTAEIVAAATKLAERGGIVETRREIAPGSDAYDLVLEIAQHKRKRAMIVGHEPDLSALVARLVGEGPPQGMLKAMVVGVSLEHGVDKAKLRFVLDPKSLEWSKSTD